MNEILIVNGLVDLAPPFAGPTNAPVEENTKKKDC